MYVTIGLQGFLKILLCDVIMQVLDQDGSATLSKSFKPATEALMSLLMWFHEWFALEPTPSKIIIVATSRSSMTKPAIPNQIPIVILHLLITV